MDHFEVFSNFLNPILRIDGTGKIVKANDAVETMTGKAARQLVGKHFAEAFGLKTLPSEDLSSITDATRYKEVSFENSLKSGVLSYSLQPDQKVEGKGPYWIVVLYDFTIETSLHKKYFDQRKDNENLSSEFLIQKAELRLSREELESKVSQMAFLLGFYHETRFVFDQNLIAKCFLKIGCEKLGFSSGFFIHTARGNSQLVSGTFFSLDGHFDPKHPPQIAVPLTPETEGGMQLMTREDIQKSPLYQELGYKQPVHSVILTLQRNSQVMGQLHLVSSSPAPQTDKHTLELLSYMLAPLDLTFENAELYRSSVTDELSQLHNVRYFRMRLQSEIRNAELEEKNLCLLLFDIDHFKKVNDTYGHQTGDEVIHQVSKCIKSSVRASDVVARYGGEEIVVLLPGASVESARMVAEKIRKKVSELVFTSNEKSFSVTISGGVSCFPTHAQDEKLLIEKADQALYHSKKNGRNQNTVASV